MPIPSWSEKQGGWSSQYVEPAIRAPVREIRTLSFPRNEGLAPSTPKKTRSAKNADDHGRENSRAKTLSDRHQLLQEFRSFDEPDDKRDRNRGISMCLVDILCLQSTELYSHNATFDCS